MKNQNNLNLDIKSKRQEMIDLMIQIYGELSDSSRAEFSKLTQKEIAKQLGIDTTRLSRFLNPTSGHIPSVNSYQKVIQRLGLILENKQIKKRFENLKSYKRQARLLKYLMPLCSIFFLTLGWFINQQTKSQQKPLETEYRLTKDERKAVMKLYAKTVQYEMILEGLIFHYSLDRGLYEDDTTGHYLKELYDKLPIIIEGNRNLLEMTKLKAEDGSYLEKLASENTDNKNMLPKIFKKLTPNLTNLKLSPNDVVNNIQRDIEGVHQKYFSLMEKDIQKKLSTFSQ